METLTRPSEAEAMMVQTQGEFIGAGRDRNAYRMPGSRWIYKFDKRGTGHVNRREYANYLRVKDTLPEGVKIPEMYLLSGDVIAAEYIDGDPAEDTYDIDNPNCWCAKICKWCEIYEFYDVCKVNVRITSDGTVYIIDLGE